MNNELDTRITAKRYSIFFRSLYNATFLEPEYSQNFLEILKNVPNDYLKGGLPKDIQFLHKTGIRIKDNVYADSGIVYIPSRPYILTVMIQKKTGSSATTDDKEAKDIFKAISKEIYDYVVKARN